MTPAPAGPGAAAARAPRPRRVLVPRPSGSLARPDPPSVGTDRLPVVDLARAGALAGAALLALTSTGDVLVVALALGLGAGRVLPGVVAVAAALAATARWGTPDLADLAASQAVLGPAGLVGPAGAATASWVAGAAVLLAWTGPAVGARRVAAALVRPSGLGQAAVVGDPGPARIAPGDRVERDDRVVPGDGVAPGRWGTLRSVVRSPADVLGALAAGGFATALVWGPGAGGGWPGRILATLLAAGVALGVGAVPRRSRVAALLGTATVALAATGLVVAVATRPDRPAPGPALPVSWVPVVVAVAAAGVAVAGAVLAARRRARSQGPISGDPPGPLGGWTWPGALGHPSVSLALLAVAARAATDLDPVVATPAPPSGGVAAAGSLLALAALVGVVAGPRWAVPAAAPALVAMAHGLLAAPASAPAGATIALGAATGVAATALVVSAVASAPDAVRPGPGGRTVGRRSVGHARSALGVLGVAVLAGVPALWRRVGVEGLDAWEQGALVAIAGALVTGVVLGLGTVGERGLLRPAHRYAPAVPVGGPRRATPVEPPPGPTRRAPLS